MQIIGEHAVVIGASMGGLTVARVLAEAYRTVTVVDRDALPDGPEQRGGVPQGRHAHGLLARGRLALEELFPGLSDDLVSRGAIQADLMAAARWYQNGVRQASADSGLDGLLVSRPLLEAAVRDRVRALPNVRVLAGRTVTGLVLTPDNRRVVGVRVGDRILDCDLAVDASGRTSRSPDWLHTAGYQRPPVDEVKMGIGYTTRTYRRTPQHAGGALAVLVGADPAHPRPAAMLAVEGDRWTLTLGGYAGDHPPLDDHGFLAFARSLPAPELAEVIRTAEPVGDPIAFRYPKSVRRRYERLRGFPAGYLVAADAMCSFNPIYGQGMTVAAAEALALRDCLAAGERELARRFFAAAAKIVDVPWSLAAGADLRFAHVPGPRPLPVRLINAYVARLQRTAAHDTVVGIAFMRVANLIDPPSVLFRPGVVLRVLAGGRRHPAPRPAITTAVEVPDVA